LAKSIPSHAHAGMESSLAAQSNPASEARMHSNWAVCRSTRTKRTQSRPAADSTVSGQPSGIEEQAVPAPLDP
jgi:hypothetical protein